MSAAPEVRGRLVDEETRCAHYAGPLDVVAIRFACCGDWYPCLHCHEADAGHPIQPWPADAADRHAVLCGVCRTTLSITEYRSAVGCPACAAPFNPGCVLHHAVYFTV